MSNARTRRSQQAQAQFRFQRQRRLNAVAQPGPLPLVMVLDHLKPNFNIAKIFRSAQAFGVREIHLVGIDWFDPAAAKGAFKHVPARFFDDFEQSFALLTGQGYRISLLDPSAGEPLAESELPPMSAFVLGHEEFGVSFDPARFRGLSQVHIEQFGSIDSLNVSVAASIAMYEFARRHRRRAGSGGCE
jgi:tRNA G18 (ribose-2'-O)-methylase SpoU